MDNKNNGHLDQTDYMSYLLPALVGLLVLGALGYYFMGSHKTTVEVPASTTTTAPVVTAEVK